MYTLMWTFWEAAALFVRERFLPPRGVQLVLTDGTVVPCSCKCEGMTDDGCVLWTASPEFREPLAVSNVCRVEADQWAPNAAVMVDVVIPDDTAFICPVCASVSFPDAHVNEGYCGRCREWTGS